MIWTEKSTPENDLEIECMEGTEQRKGFSAIIGIGDGLDDTWHGMWLNYQQVEEVIEKLKECNKKLEDLAEQG